MKLICVFLFVLYMQVVSAQKRWDGEAGDGQWGSAANWLPDGVPSETDDIEFDHRHLWSDYTVLFPAGALTTTINSLRIISGNGRSIRIEIPNTNTITPALIVTGNGTAFSIEDGGVFVNSSGAPSGDAIRVDHGFRIANGGRYIHHTSRGNASLINQLVNENGTETGIFEFDVPGTAGYTVSLTGNTFGSLVFSSSSGAKSYNGSGASALRIRGDLIVNAGATLTSSMTADILIERHLEVKGTLQLHPTSAGAVNRTLQLSGAPFSLMGEGNILVNSNFNKIVVKTGATGYLNRTIILPNSNNIFEIQTGAKLYLQDYHISGNGTLVMQNGSALDLKAPRGIESFSTEANINTANTNISPHCDISFSGSATQTTGNSFPSELNTLAVEKSGGDLLLSKSLQVSGTVLLNSGRIFSSQASPLILRDAEIISPQNQYGNINQGWEQSFIEGPVKLISNQTGLKTAPVGKGTYFAPIQLNQTQDGYSSRVIEYFPATCMQLIPVNLSALHHISTQEYWSIEDEVSSSKPVIVTLSWRNNSKVAEEAGFRNDLRVAYFGNDGMGNRWNAAGNTAVVSGNESLGTITANIPIQNFNFLTIGSASVFNSLPFRQISLNVQAEKTGVRLNWNVNEADNITGFGIERSRTGQIYEKIHQVALNSNSDNKNFAFRDPVPNSGNNYYRISVKTTQDSIFYSETSIINFKPSSLIRLFPNPARQEIFIFFPTPSSKTNCSIVRSNGLVVRKEILIKEQTTWIPISDLQPGYYLLTVPYRNELIALAFLKY